MRVKEFFAFDTETDRGKAFIISVAGNGIYTYRTKTKEDITRFLHDVIKKKWGNIGWCYNLDYDVIAILKYYGDDIITRLYLTKEIVIDGISISYVPRKFLTLKYRGKTVYIFELMQYFNMSLDNAGKKYLGKRKKEIGGKKVKKKLLELFRQNPTKVIEYCEYDAELTVELAEKLESMLQVSGIDVVKYYSCGYLAKQYLKKHGVSFNPLRDEKVIDFVRPAYFGGRIEFMRRGTFKRVYQYDINSAYPYAITKLEQIIGYKFAKQVDPTARYFFVECTVNIPKDTHFSPLAYRNKQGLITYPTGVLSLTIDCITFNTLKKEGMIKSVQKVLNVYTNGEKPFKKLVERMYNRRQVAPADENYILKIILNSLYGKFAEKRKDYVEIEESEALLMLDGHLTDNKRPRIIETEVGYFMRKVYYSKNSNLIYAALITSEIRNLLYKVMKELPPRSLIGTMTDCIFSTVPVPNTYISTKKQLGKFGFKCCTSLYVVGSGVYGTKDKMLGGKKVKGENKLRGYNVKTSLVNLAGKNAARTTLKIPSTERLGAGKFVVQGLDLDELNVISDRKKNLNLNFDTKRKWENNGFKNFGESLKRNISSTPLFHTH